MSNSVFIFKRPDYWATPYKTKEEAMKAIMRYEGRNYSDNAWEIVEQEFGDADGTLVGASVCVAGKYKWLEGNELKEWQNREKPR